MKLDDFDYVSNIVKQRSGLVLTQDKAYLLESRLMPVARKRGMKGLDDLVSSLRVRGDESLLRDVTEAMTTNESFFFRDIKPFDLFRDITLPRLLESRKDRKSFRIWCAACSSGQEPFSLALILQEVEAKLAGWRVDIVGTDISTEMLEKAKTGLYTQFEVQRGLPIQLLLKYFQKRDELWQVDQTIRSKVQFREFNLLDPLAPLGEFDVIFCRNVLIYFDQETKTSVLNGMSSMLPGDGVLFLGGAETVLGVSDRFKPVTGQRGVYCLTNSGGSLADPL